MYELLAGVSWIDSEETERKLFYSKIIELEAPLSALFCLGTDHYFLWGEGAGIVIRKKLSA